MPAQMRPPIRSALLYTTVLLAVTIYGAAATPFGSSQSSQPGSTTKTQPENPTPSTNAAHPPDQTAACLPVDRAAQSVNQDICVSAHVFDVVELSDGTRFLDVCPPGTPDKQCRFTILCPPADRDDVGDLGRFRNQDIHLRGMVLSTHGRMGIVLSHIRQLNGGPPKFRPNPRLLHNFDGQSTRNPIQDPNLRASGHHRSFMNTRDTETRPTR